MRLLWAVLFVVVFHARANAQGLGKLESEGVITQKTAWPAGKDKRCCGYPLAETNGFALRYYWLATQRSHRDFEAWAAIYTQRVQYLGTFTAGFVKSLILEGSGLLADGRVINYDGRCKFGVGTCFEILDPVRYPFGRGAKRRSLVPFRSVAVDRRLIKIGDPLYIPEFDGITLPNGEIHDGCVRADDTGGGIKQRKMDFFVVRYSNFRFLLRRMWGVNWITPHVGSPRCQYLHTQDRPLHWPHRYAAD